jgi:hypothetical protein
MKTVTFLQPILTAELKEDAYDLLKTQEIIDWKSQLTS